MTTDDQRISVAEELMAGFAERTGLTSTAPPRRYLWTDAFAVCNFLALADAAGDAEYTRLARILVDQVHVTLGRHRPDDSRRGWISGLSEEEGKRHPTMGGLRIGKPHPERAVGEAFDAALEWDRDGQYFHDLTRWTHALEQMARTTDDPVYHRWARELAVTAHRAFSIRSRVSGRGRMIWKASIDLSRPLVSAMGQLDPIDGYVTCSQLERADANADQALQLATSNFATMIDVRALATSDPLGIGSLLLNACWLSEPSPRPSPRPGERRMLDALIATAASGLRTHLRSSERRLPAEERLAFREIGLAIGLGAVERMHDLAATRGVVSPVTELARRFSFLREEIESFWLRQENQHSRSWSDHVDINEVMLATCLVPDGLFARTRPDRPPHSRARSRE